MDQSSIPQQRWSKAQVGSFAYNRSFTGPRRGDDDFYNDYDDDGDDGDDDGGDDAITSHSCRTTSHANRLATIKMTTVNMGHPCCWHYLRVAVDIAVLQLVTSNAAVFSRAGGTGGRGSCSVWLSVMLIVASLTTAAWLRNAIYLVVPYIAGLIGTPKKYP